MSIHVSVESQYKLYGSCLNICIHNSSEAGVLCAGLPGAMRQNGLCVLWRFIDIEN